MRNLFTLKLMLISLLTAMSMVAKADYIEFKTKDGLCYGIDTDAKYATLSKYEGAATKVVIPKSVVYKGVAYDVTSLDDNCFADCSSLISVSIPSSVTSLGIGCFMWCSSLTSITIPSCVTHLGAGCFEGCSSLTSINIPSSVTDMEYQCFDACSSLKTVICEMPIPIEGIFFYKTPIDQAMLYVPKSSFSSYQSSKTWNEFRTILPIASNHPSKP